MTNKTPEQKLAELQEKHDTLQGKHNTLNAENKQLSIAHNALTTDHNSLKDAHNTLTTDHSVLQDAHDNLAKEHDDFKQAATKEIGELSEQLSNTQQDLKSGKITVTIGNDRYQVHGKVFHIKGRGEVTIDQLLQDTGLQKELVAKGSGILVKITKG